LQGVQALVERTDVGDCLEAAASLGDG